MFWNVAGIGLVERQEFKALLRMIKIVGAGAMVPPPYWESDLPLGSIPDMSPEAEEAALVCMAEALFKTLKAEGKFRKIEQAVPEIEKIMASTREVLRDQDWKSQ